MLRPAPGRRRCGRASHRYRSSGPPDLRLVVDAAQRHTAELAVRRPGNAHGDAGFARARRSHQAEHAALHVRRQPADGQKFDNALLDLIKPVVVGVQVLRAFWMSGVSVSAYARESPGRCPDRCGSPRTRRTRKTASRAAKPPSELSLRLLRELQVQDAPLYSSVSWAGRRPPPAPTG
jgi:hypothetical protein